MLVKGATARSTVYMRFSLPERQNKSVNMYIARDRAQFKINTHGYWKWHLCIPDGLSVVQCSLGHVFGIDTISVAWNECCLSLQVLSSIRARSTIIYRFLCVFLCFSLYQSIKIKTVNMYTLHCRILYNRFYHWILVTAIVWCLWLFLNVIKTSLRWKTALSAIIPQTIWYHNYVYTKGYWVASRASGKWFDLGPYNL